MAGVIVITTKKGRSGFTPSPIPETHSLALSLRDCDYNIMNCRANRRLQRDGEEGGCNFTCLYNFHHGLYAEDVSALIPLKDFLRRDPACLTHQRPRWNTSVRVSYAIPTGSRSSSLPPFMQTASAKLHGRDQDLQTYVSMSALFDPG